ncbi:MAG: glycosyl transferase group 1 [Bacteroidetes bacterium]|jgi:glycosyltransferase involved in cell wall biosynthesis|nr:glycosyl transferase group 1 [Bacteroidota bacterium]
MKVVQVSTSDMGGAGIAAKRLHLALLENGVDSHFLTLFRLGGETKNHSVILDQEKGSLEKLKSRVKNSVRYRMPSLFKNEREEFYKSKPKTYDHFSFPDSDISLEENELIKSADIIHLHWVSDGMLDYKKFFKKVKKPIVWTLHDMNPFTGGCHHADESTGFMNDCSVCIQIKGTKDESLAAKNLKIKENALKEIDEEKFSIVTPSFWLGELAAKSKVMERFNRKVIPNIIPSEVFGKAERLSARKELNVPENADVVLFVANDVTNKRKGITELIDAINSMENENLFICTVGNKIKEEGINKNISQFGFVNSEQQMAKIYSAANVFVLPSHAENFPNTIIEALFSGLPVAASNVGGVPEQINSSNGVLFQKGNRNELKTSIQKILENKNNFSAEKIKEDAKKKYSKDLIVNKHIELYKGLLH